MRHPAASRPRPSRRDRFGARQRAYFHSADPAKLRWQTVGPFFAATERALLIPADGAGRFLEVGCGEGGNLFHLGPRRDLTVGADLSFPKARFAATAISWGRFLCADALRLPFPDGVFDRVLCRDLLHHLELGRRRGAVAELYRVCRPAGEVVVIEPNGRNPLMAAFALLVPAERGLLHSTPSRVVAEVGAVGAQVRAEMMQPLPMARLLLHYRFGAPALGRRRSIARLLDALDLLLKKVLPPSLWAYVIVRGLARVPRPGDASASAIRRAIGPSLSLSGGPEAGETPDGGNAPVDGSRPGARHPGEAHG